MAGTGGIDDFTITFTGLPSGATIDPITVAANCFGGSVAITAFCSLSPLGAPFVESPWIPVLSNGDDTITFTAPAGVSLNSADRYFTNIFFTAPQETVTFTGGWSSEQGVIPEPSSITLLSTLIVLGAIGAWMARRRQTVA